MYVTNHNELSRNFDQVKQKTSHILSIDKYLAYIQMIYIGANKSNRKATFSYNHGQIPT